MKAHRAMLIARCDMMRAMLNGDFREAHANVVSNSFPHNIYFADSNNKNVFNDRAFGRLFSPVSPNTHSINYFAIYTPTKYLKFQRRNV